MWSPYIENDLIPRIHGFELLMASYAMCHMKLDMVLTKLGYTPSDKPPRLSVYLTNSLEEGEAANQTLPFAHWLSNEVKEASKIKRDLPIMCIIGNPPYKGESENKGEWIMGQMEAYKKEPGGFERLKERNPKWINDDYVKFIRLSEQMIDKNGEGILGFITNHGYLDNPTFRGMRWHLLKTFDKIYVIDLHGNAKKKEVCPDGSPDKNVFDIQQGVAIIIAVKTTVFEADGRKKGTDIPLAQVFHSELWGDRTGKYEALWGNGLTDSLTPIAPKHPHYLFIPRDYELEKEYLSGFSVAALMSLNTLGIQTHRDAFAIDIDRSSLIDRISDFFNRLIPSGEILEKYSLRENNDWKLETQRNGEFDLENIQRIDYRPFDTRFVYYDRKIVDRDRRVVMKHVHSDNIIMSISKRQSSSDFRHAIVSNFLQESCLISLQTKEQGYSFPLYIYQEDELDKTRRVNMETKIRTNIENQSADEQHGAPDEVAIFDYIYGVLHCPVYREAYNEFLRTDFPHIPYPSSPEVFWDVSEKGTLLRCLHLMEDEAVGETPYAFSGDGMATVLELNYVPVSEATGSIFINDKQQFEGVPLIAWEFWIGGHQPAQKWLKDRKGRNLSFDDVLHYQKIIKILIETDRIMKTITMPLSSVEK